MRQIIFSNTVVGQHQMSGSKSCTQKGRPLVETFPPPQGLGDAIFSGLKKLGITPESYASAKQSVGLSGNCDCKGRREWLNKFTSAIGLGKNQGEELQKIITLENIGNHDVHGCEIHGKCLPDLRVANQHLATIRETGYHPCQGCEEKT